MRKLLCTFALLAATLGAQSLIQTHPNPDCQIFFTLTATGQASGIFDNRQQGCTTWAVVYNNSGFTGVNVTLQSATAAAPATFNAGFPVQQTIITGANPASDTTAGYLWIVGMNAYVRVKLTTSAGSGIVSGALFGWRIPNAGSQ